MFPQRGKGMKKRDRGSAILIENNNVALIKRVRDDSVYYVFPGGGIKDGETPEEATKREALEELGVDIKVNDCFTTVNFNGTQYFFLSEMIGGEFGTGQGEEYDDKRNSGLYIPMWIDIESLSSVDVKPREVATKIQMYFK